MRITHWKVGSRGKMKKDFFWIRKIHQWPSSRIPFLSVPSVSRLCAKTTRFCLNLRTKKKYFAALVLINLANSYKSVLHLPSRTSFQLREVTTFTLLNVALLLQQLASSPSSLSLCLLLLAACLAWWYGNLHTSLHHIMSSCHHHNQWTDGFLQKSSEIGKLNELMLLAMVTIMRPRN